MTTLAPPAPAANPDAGRRPTDRYRPLFGLSRTPGWEASRSTSVPVRLRIDSVTAADGTGGRWHGILVVEGVRTTDHREIAPGALTWRDLPLPLMLLTETSWGHDGAVICGSIDSISNVDGAFTATGSFDTGEAGIEAERLVNDQMLRWVSADMEVISSEYIEVNYGGGFEDDYGWSEPDDWWERVTEGRIMGASIVPFPALPQCVIAMEGADLPETAEDNGLPTLAPVAVVASGLHIVPPVVPPLEWFEDPHLPGPTHWTVTDDGRVFGHLALWDTEHVGLPGMHVTPPRSPSNYAYFRTKACRALGSDGEVDVRTGVLSMGTGHADRHLGYRAAADHYDNTGTGMADVATGEDEFGIWMAGALRPGVTPEQVRIMRGSDVSGDWRNIGGELDMTAVLVCNAGGFPVASLAASAVLEVAGGSILYFDGRVRAGVEGGRQVSLVAAGMLHDDPMGQAVRTLGRRLAAMEATVNALRPLAAAQLSQRIGIEG